MDELSKIKKDKFLEALDNYSEVYLHFTTTDKEAVIPPFLFGKDVVVFVYGKNLPIPIPDLEINDEGVSGTLSFNGDYYYCFVPWKSVLMIATDTGEVWPLPHEEHLLTLLDYVSDKIKPKDKEISTEHLDELVSKEKEQNSKSFLKLVNDSDELGEISQPKKSEATLEEQQETLDKDKDPPKGPPRLKII